MKTQTTHKEGFKKVTTRRRPNRKNPTIIKTTTPPTSNNFDVLVDQPIDIEIPSIEDQPTSQRKHQELKPDQNQDP